MGDPSTTVGREPVTHSNTAVLTVVLVECGFLLEPGDATAVRVITVHCC